MPNLLQVKQSPVTRHVGEEYSYNFTLTDKVPSGTYANAVNTIHLEQSNGTFGADLSGSLLSGSASISAGVFTSSKFVADAATAGKRYKMILSIDIDGDAWKWFLFIDMVGT